MRPLILHPDRLFPADRDVRAITRRLYDSVANLPIISPHGHTDPQWFAEDAPFANASDLLLQPDHYVFRMLYSQGIALEALGLTPVSGDACSKVDPREAWRILAANYHLFRGTPSRMWLDWVFAEGFGLEVQLEAATADLYFDRITEALATPAFRPRALFDRFNIEVLTTTESPLDTLEHHRTIAASGWNGRVLTAYRPDPVVDPDYEGFADNLAVFAQLTGEDTFSYAGYLAAHRKRRAFFAEHGATSTDHGHPTALTADLSRTDAEALFARVTHGQVTPQDAELFRAQMLTEMAGMSVEDGLVMQIHPGAMRNHNASCSPALAATRGRHSHAHRLCARAVAAARAAWQQPRSHHHPLHARRDKLCARTRAARRALSALRLGPAWWFHDSPEGMRGFACR